MIHGERMSKLIDKLNQATKAVPQPMGFRAVQPSPAKPKPLLIASTAQASNVSSADAVLFTKFSSAGALPKIARAFSNIPWGLWLENIGRREIGPMVKAGCDFAVFPASTALATTQDAEKIGKILQVEASLNEGLLKTVNELPIDAVLVTSKQGEEPSLTWHRLMLLQRFANLLTKPLLVAIPAKVSADELQLLWEAGVDGVVVEVGAREPAERLTELRQKIDKLTFPPRKQGKVEALLPHLTEETSTVTEEEEEEED